MRVIQKKIDTKTKVLGKKYKEIVKELQLFATQEKRHFPWRENQTPYRVLVSELMLQQTQVGRVAEKYEVFLKKFPNLLALRDAHLEDVLKEWKGLGYMRRAKSLHILAKVSDTLPEKREDLLLLPGVGPYTSGAIMAFAYDTFFPIVETNIKTVLCHHLCQKNEKELCIVTKEGDELVAELFEYSHLSARNFYEAMMDYGTHLKKQKALVCKQTKKQKPFRGSLRELRAKVLYEITEKKKVISKDERNEIVLTQLVQEGFVQKRATGYEIVP